MVMVHALCGRKEILLGRNHLHDDGGDDDVNDEMMMS